jgi:hypothetical protein
MDIVQLVQIAVTFFVALAGWPALLSAVITLLEYFGVITPAGADGVNFLANVAVFLAVLAAVIFGYADFIPQLDAGLAGLAKIIIDILIILGVPTLNIITTKRYTSRVRSLTFFARRLK